MRLYRLWSWRLIVALFFLTLLSACNDSSSSTSSRSSAPSTAALRVADPYAMGPYMVDTFVYEEGGEEGAPKRTRLFVPKAWQGRSYPMIQFNAGFQGSVDAFQTVLTHLASYGFIIVAPQLIPPPQEGGNPGTAPGIEEEVALAKDVAVWAQSTLLGLLSPSGDISRYGLVGHSRGGQIMWRLLLDNPGLAHAIAGLDPVDGDAPPFSTSPGPLVTANPFLQGVPAYTLGTGLGATGGAFACAPENRNYRLFYEASEAPSWLALAEDFGHSDMVDEGSYDTLACASNPLRTEMIRFTGGQLVAFFAHVFYKSTTTAYLESFDTAPIVVSGEFK